MNTVQMHTVEFQVPGLVDGVTPAPAFSFDPRSPAYKKADADGIVRFTAAQMLALTGGNFGTFDPDFGTGGTFADRFLPLVEVVSNGVAGAVSIDIVDDNGLVVQQNLFAGAEVDFYDRDTNFVPQGSDIAFSGYTATPTQPVIIRIGVIEWTDLEDYGNLRSLVFCPDFPAPTWADVLGNNPNSGGNDPIVDDGDFLVLTATPFTAGSLLALQGKGTADGIVAGVTKAYDVTNDRWIYAKTALLNTSTWFYRESFSWVLCIAAPGSGALAYVSWVDTPTNAAITGAGQQKLVSGAGRVERVRLLCAGNPGDVTIGLLLDGNVAPVETDVQTIVTNVLQTFPFETFTWADGQTMSLSIAASLATIGISRALVEGFIEYPA